MRRGFFNLASLNNLPIFLVPKQHNTNYFTRWNPTPGARISAFIVIALNPVISCMKLLYPLNEKDAWAFFTLYNYNLAH